VGGFQHKSVGTGLTQAEYEQTDTGHQFASQATGMLLYASSSTVNTSLAIGATGQLLQVSGGIPAWTSQVRIPNGGDLVVGHTAQETISAGDGSTDMVPEVQILGTAGADSSLLLATFSTTATIAAAPSVVLVKGGNASIGSHTVVTDDEVLGSLVFGADDGTDLESIAAWIKAEVDGTPGTGDMPGRLIFGTSADGAEVPTERLRITAGGDVLIANSSGLVVGYTGQETISIDGSTDLVPEVQVLGTAAADASLMLAAFSTTATIAGSPIMAFVKGGNASIGSHTVVTDGEELGNIVAFGDDGTDLESIAAQIQFEVDGSPGTGDMPGRIIFATTADGAQAATERLRINAAGDTILANGGGLIIGHPSQETISIGDGDTDLVPEVQVLGTGQADASLMLAAFSTTATVAGAPSVALVKGGNATIGSHTILTDDEVIGTITAYADDGVDLESVAASIQFELDGSPSAGDTPGAILLRTTADGAETPTTRLTVSAAGLVTIPGATTIGGTTTLNGNVAGTGVKDEDDMASNSAVAVSTQQSIKAYVDATITKEFWVPVLVARGNGSFPYNSNVGDFPVATAGSAQDARFAFYVPLDFTSLTSAVVVMIPDATETAQWDVTTDFGGDGEAYNLNSDSITNGTESVTANDVEEVDIADALTGLAAGDYVGVLFAPDTSDLRLVGLRIKYA